MAKNVFEQIGDIRNNVNRSTFDWSHDNNFTTELGRITPVFTELCPPNSSLRINPSFGLKFMPMMFPIQTKMKAYLSFYKIPLRTLWKDYMNWISDANNPDSKYEVPYIKFDTNTAFADKGLLGVSGLSDYIGVPITTQFTADSPLTVNGDPEYDPEVTKYFQYSDYSSQPVGGFMTMYTFTGSGVSGMYKWLGITQPTIGSAPLNPNDPSADVKRSNYGIAFLPVSFTGTSGSVDVTLSFKGNKQMSILNAYDIVSHGGNIFEVVALAPSSSGGNKMDIIAKGSRYRFSELRDTPDGNYQFDFTFRISIDKNRLGALDNKLALLFKGSTAWVNAPTSETSNSTTLKFTKLIERIHTETVGPLSETICPYVTSSPNPANENGSRIKISAYPYRAYEAIYNAYIRNIKNNPFTVAGEKRYNEWITNNEGGADTTAYHLFYANWASDAYTTALPSPQQGTAPLVGLTQYTKTVQLENGHTETKLATAIVDEDGSKYDVSFESNGEALKGVKYTKMDDSTPVRPIDNLFDVVTSGISIQDFRNVNAYQRYLELNQFRGFSYKDIIQGRFDVNVRYDSLQMPEYIGGITRDVVINPVTQTVETSGDGSYIGALGSQSGDAGVYGSTNQNISVFCDEESLVMGILYVVPMPVYTQILPKYLTYRSRLDSFNPEFDHISYQPIRFSELCPVQQYGQGKPLDDVFGYQRPWYEYVQKYDSAHGLFRTQLRNFLMNRVFQQAPELGSEFTTVNPEHVNDVFSVTETTDKILGQIHFDATAKLPISRVVVPKLE